MAIKRTSKKRATKSIIEDVAGDFPSWKIKFGQLKKGPGRPNKIEHLFKVVGEKLPITALAAVKKHLTAQELGVNGVYIAHDSMGCARYVGRGNIFQRLDTHRKAHPLELAYFSFYVVQEKQHEREIETLLIRAAGFLLQFNDRKKRVDISPGNIADFEPGTHFYERQRPKGKKPSKPKPKK